jgi:hypothetical protein
VGLIAELLSGLVEFLLEAVLQILADACVELGLGALRRSLRPDQPARPGVVVFVHLALGGAAGVQRLRWFPIHFAHSMPGRLVTLTLAPRRGAGAPCWHPARPARIGPGTSHPGIAAS